MTDYLANEESEHPHPDPDDPAVKLVKFYLFKWLSAWSEKDVFSNVRFSSGSTANVGPDRAMKVHWDPRFEEIPWRLSTIFDSVEAEPCQWSVALQPVPFELYNLIVEGSDYDPQWTSWFYPEPDMTKNGRISRLLFVPKSAVSKRTISMEFSTMNFWQNGVDGSIRNCRTMPKENIDFTDQYSSRELCRLASKTGDLTTVDLTAASDSITADQVWEFLSNVPGLRKWLFATRSTWTRYYHPDCGGYPDGLYFDIRLEKFAAMGSCACFTVETIIFTAAAFAACALADPEGERTWTIRVYGDDIIIPTWAYRMLLKIFKRLGWRVNEEKSFSTGFFREACGAVCYRGKDITFPTASRTALDVLPTHTGAARHTTKKSSSVTWAEATAACEMANKLLSVGAWFTRYVYIMFLVRNGCSFMSRQPSIQELQEALIPKDVEHRLDYPTAPLTIWSFSHALGEVHHVRPRCKDHLNTSLFKREKKRNRLGGKKYPYLTIIEGRGIYSSVPVDTVKRKLQPGERLALWLYSAQYTKRRPLSDDCCGRQFEEPLLVEHILAERSKGLREKVVLLSPQ